ncbi:N-acetyltransferase [Clostridium tertium]|uniref:Putative N-acetyltransferase YjaB n=1 Tax=Clostridium tertium TaxID=1559 RepID=A0A6N2Y8C0_9CLOT
MYTIRKIKSEEIEKVMELWKASTIKAHSFIEKEYWENNYEVVKNIYIPMSETFVYDDGEEIRGFISIINKEFIGALFIDIDYQGLGIGSKLIDYVDNKYNKLELVVYKENESAVKFYKKKSFKIIEEQKNEDSGLYEYIMEK